jgi:hypothetical protein
MILLNKRIQYSEINIAKGTILLRSPEGLRETLAVVVSIVGLSLMRKWGAALTTFTLIYAFAFNTFNIIYYSIYLLNGLSAIINAIATVYIFKSIFASRFR